MPLKTEAAAKREADASRTRELWQQYAALARRDCSFLYWVMLKRSCSQARAEMHVAKFQAEHGGRYPADAPPEA